MPVVNRIISMTVTQQTARFKFTKGIIWLCHYSSDEFSPCRCWNNEFITFSIASNNHLSFLSSLHEAFVAHTMQSIKPNSIRHGRLVHKFNLIVITITKYMHAHCTVNSNYRFITILFLIFTQLDNRKIKSNPNKYWKKDAKLCVRSRGMLFVFCLHLPFKVWNTGLSSYS